MVHGLQWLTMNATISEMVGLPSQFCCSLQMVAPRARVQNRGDSLSLTSAAPVLKQLQPGMWSLKVILDGAGAG